MKTLVIAGAGPGLGVSLGKAFGANGFRVALLARRRAALDAHVFQLKKAGLEAAGYTADVEDAKQVEKALAYVRQDYGSIDALVYCAPSPRATGALAAARTTEEAVLAQCKVQVLGAVSCARRVLPEMLERKAGTLLFTTCQASVRPSPALTPMSVAMTGLRTYALCLYAELAPLGVYAAHVSIGVELAAGSAAGDPDRVAVMIHELHARRDRPELVIAPVPAVQ